MNKKKKSKIFNPKQTKAQRRYLRNNMTRAEIILWSALKNRQLMDTKFRRQYGIGNYIVDFYCPDLNFAIEVDGETHYQKSAIQHDEKRKKFLNNLSIKVIRFTNDQVFENLDGILIAIEQKINELKNQNFKK